MKQFLSFVHKEFLHILRDRRTMLILLVMPVVLVILFGYAITTEVKGTNVAVLDLSRDDLTRGICDEMAANAYFDLTHDVRDMAEVERLFRRGSIDMAIVFGEGFAENVRHGGRARIQLLADGAEPNQASVRTAYAGQVLASYAARMAAQSGVAAGGGQMQITPVTRMLYNPQQRSEYNFVPGVIGLILMLICAMMTSIAIVSEKEDGTMEVLLASPLPPITIVVAKLVPYFAISCINLATILLLSTQLLRIPIAGSLGVLVGVSLVYVIVALFLGLLISSLVSSRLAAMLLSLLLIVPSVYLSGLAFPLESMPEALQRASNIVPARWYVEAARKLMIQGVAPRYVLHETVVLAGMALVLLLVSWRLFKIRLE